MNGEYILLGDFRGKFFTQQSVALDSVDLFPEDLRHAVRVYSGELSNAHFEDDYKAEKYRKHGSFLLVNVPRIEISPVGKGPFHDARIYNFTQLLLIEPKVVKTYELNGKTYGEIESKAYGITEKYPLVKPIDPDKNENGPPPLVGEDFTEPAKTDNPPPYSDAFNTTKMGCGAVMGGCLAYIWQIIFLLLLILFISALFKACEGNGDQCAEKEKTKRELQAEEARRDSAKVEYDRNLKNAIAGYGTIYFFKNSTDFHINSTGNNSPISRIFNLMDAYTEKKFIIEGYHTGASLENVPKLDALRAIRMRDSLVMMGIDVKRLSIRAKADSVLLDPTLKMSRFLINKNESREYNRNMRVQVKVDTLQ
jgi:hypothetical protein